MRNILDYIEADVANFNYRNPLPVKERITIVSMGIKIFRNIQNILIEKLISENKDSIVLVNGKEVKIGDSVFTSYKSPIAGLIQFDQPENNKHMIGYWYKDGNFKYDASYEHKIIYKKNKNGRRNKIRR